MRERQRAGRLETLGAWLRVWTPPRDVYVPPIPWRKVWIGGGVLVAIGIFTALVIAPAIDSAKDEGEAKRQAAAEKRAAALRAQVEAEQQPRTGRIAAGRDAALVTVEDDIGRDAQARFGALGRPADCEPAPGTDPGAQRAVFDCTATTSEIVAGGPQKGAKGELAIPYRAILDFGRRRYAFCKTNPKPGELAIPDPEHIVELPAACRA